MSDFNKKGSCKVRVVEEVGCKLVGGLKSSINRVLELRLVGVGTGSHRVQRMTRTGVAEMRGKIRSTEE